MSKEEIESDGESEFESEDQSSEDYSEESSGQAEAELVPEAKPPIKRSTIVIAALLGAALVGTAFMVVKTGPQRASADDVIRQKDVDDKIGAFISKSPENLRAMRELLQGAEKVEQKFLSYPSAAQVPLDRLTSNPFRFALPDAAKPTPGGSDMADAMRQQQSDHDIALTAAQKLHLQSILVSGAGMTCMIDGQLYSTGQTVGPFIIEKINPKSVIVKMGTYRFEVGMPQ